jgi:hypothetical protein
MKRLPFVVLVHSHLIENIPRRYNVPTNQTQLLVAES